MVIWFRLNACGVVLSGTNFCRRPPTARAYRPDRRRKAIAHSGVIAGEARAEALPKTKVVIVNFLPPENPQTPLGGPDGDLRIVLTLIEDGLKRAAEAPQLIAQLERTTTAQIATTIAESVGSPFAYVEYVEAQWAKVVVAHSGTPLLRQFCADLAMARWSAMGVERAGQEADGMQRIFAAISRIFDISSRNDTVAAGSSREIARDARLMRNEEKESNWLQGIDDE